MRVLGEHNPNYLFCLRAPFISFMNHDLPIIIEPLTPVTYCFFETKYSFLWNSIYTLLRRYNGSPYLYRELFVSYTNILFLLFWLRRQFPSMVQIAFLLWVPIHLSLVPNYTLLSLLPNPSFCNLGYFFLSLHSSP